MSVFFCFFPLCERCAASSQSGAMTALAHAPGERPDKLARASAATDVAGQIVGIPLGEHFVVGVFDAIGGGCLADVIEHHDPAHDERQWVGEPLARDVGSRAV